MKYIPNLVELPGGVWVNPDKVEAVAPHTDGNGSSNNAMVWFVDGKMTFNGVSAEDVARAVNWGVTRNTIFEN